MRRTYHRAPKGMRLGGEKRWPTQATGEHERRRAAAAAPCRRRARHGRRRIPAFSDRPFRRRRDSRGAGDPAAIGVAVRRADPVADPVADRDARGDPRRGATRRAVRSAASDACAAHRAAYTAAAHAGARDAIPRGHTGCDSGTHARRDPGSDARSDESRDAGAHTRAATAIEPAAHGGTHSGVADPFAAAAVALDLTAPPLRRGARAV